MTENIVNQAAVEAFASTGGTEEAKNKLRKQANKDEDLRDALLEMGISEAIWWAQRMTRTKIANQDPEDQNPVKYSDELQEALKKSPHNTFGFLHWPMMDGSRLKDADKEHVLSDADRFFANAKGNAERGRFLQLVGNKMKAGQKVGQVWKETQLTKLMQRVKADDGMAMAGD